jgi:hypothetical protein
MSRKILIGVVVILLIGDVILFGIVPEHLDKTMNRVTTMYSEPIEQAYMNLPFMSEMHCDMLLWNRNFLEEHNHSHVDLPRMQQLRLPGFVYSIHTPSLAN